LRCPCKTHDDTGHTALGIAVPLQVLRDGDEDTGWKRHVEDSVSLLATLLELLDVFPQIDERVVLVVLAGDISAETTELLQLLFHILRRCLDIGLDAAKVLLVVHLRPGVPNDLDILGEEAISVLCGVKTMRRSS
jgi:hypothetical protein